MNLLHFVAQVCGSGELRENECESSLEVGRFFPGIRWHHTEIGKDVVGSEKVLFAETLCRFPS